MFISLVSSKIKLFMEVKWFKNNIFSIEMYRWFGTVAIMSDDQLFTRFLFLKVHTNTINYGFPCKELR